MSIIGAHLTRTLLPHETPDLSYRRPVDHDAAASIAIEQVRRRLEEWTGVPVAAEWPCPHGTDGFTRVWFTRTDTGGSQSVRVAVIPSARSMDMLVAEIARRMRGVL